ncbi:MAG: TonB-dependent receptor [Gammaproteobacteria bacterium]|nr:TonB-dependent receptor [Gammaproteobacteria bacterium]
MNNRLALLAAMIACVCCSARADDNSVQLGSVVVTDTGLPTPVRILPDNTLRVNGASLKLIGAIQPSQLLTTVPGAWITAGSGQENLMALRSPLFTGAGACGAFLLLEDGVPIQPAGFCDVNALFEINTEQAGALEVVRGPGSVLYGSNALNGIINVLTRPPQSLPQNNASLERGSNDYTRLETSVGSWNGVQGFRASANAAHDGGFRADSGYDQQKLTLRSDYVDGGLSRETLLEATNLNQKTAGYIYGLDAYENPALRYSNPTPGAFRDAQSMRLLQIWQLPLSTGSQIDITPYLRHNWTSFTEHYLPGEPIQTEATNSGGLQFKLRTEAGPSTSVIYGSDAEYAHGTVQEYQPGPATGIPPSQAATRPQGFHYDYAADSRTLAMYVDINHAWTPQWLFSGGLRVEGVRYTYENFLPVGNTQADGTPCPDGGCLFYRPADRADQFVNVMPKFGISYLAGENQTLYFDAGRGARAPQTIELYELQSQQAVADLHSETVNSFEFGWRGQTGAAGWDTDVYYMLKDNFIFRDANGFIVSDGRMRSRGVEFSFHYALSSTLTTLMDATYAVHSYAFSQDLGHGNTISDGNDVKYSPRTIGSVRLNWRPSADAQLEMAWTHVGGYWLDESNQHRYGGQDLLNLYAQYGLSAGWSVALRITNLTNKAYAERADYSFGNYRYLPGDGRETFIQVQKDF